MTRIIATLEKPKRGAQTRYIQLGKSWLPWKYSIVHLFEGKVIATQNFESKLEAEQAWIKHVCQS